jgi:hypothetical protein
MTSAAIIEDVKKKLEAKEIERRQANSDSWNKLDNYQEQQLLKRWVGVWGGGQWGRGSLSLA